MVNSVNTNSGAIVALQSLNKTNAQLDAVQKQVSTGFRVADAVDDGAAFAVAQGLRGNVKGDGAVGERLSAANGLLSVTSSALGSISDTLNNAKATLTKLSDGNLSASERTQYTSDFQSYLTEVNNFIAQGSFNGTNLLNNNTAINVIYDASGGTFAITGQNTSTLTAAAFGATASAGAASGLLTGAFKTLSDAVGTSLSTVGGYSRAITDQQNFIGVLSDATTTGIGSIVDADLAKASAQLQSLQIRQQLGTQSLSIANQSPSILLSLFK